MSDKEQTNNPLQCPCCKMKFTHLYKCNKHIVKCRSTQVDDKKFKCSCAKSYKYKQGLEKHQATCITFKPVQNNPGSNFNSSVVGAFNNSNIYNTTNNPVINLNPTGQETFDHLTEKDVQSVLRSGNGAFRKLAYLMYAHPDNKNITFLNRKDGLVKHVNSDGNVDISDSEKALNQVVSSIEDQLDAYIAEFCMASDENDSSALGRLLTELSDQNAAGTNDSKHMDIIYRLVIAITTVAKQLLSKYEKQRILAGAV
jgi:hypothetical protein